MKNLAFVLFGVLFMSSCTEDPKIDDPIETPYQTTAYDFQPIPTLPPPNFQKDNMPTEEGVMLGRMLFYDPILSRDSTQSCASCHNQEFGFTDNGRALSLGVNKTEGRRNSMPIFNLQWHLEGFFWDGRAELLRHQAVLPIQDPVEMDETIANVIAKLQADSDYSKRFKQAFNVTAITEETIGKALEQFMSIIVSGNSKFDIAFQLGFNAVFTDQEMRGMAIFNTEAKPEDATNKGGDCFHCHGTSLFMAREFKNNGLDSIYADQGRYEVTGSNFDIGKFKVPSLRNIEVTGPYMHDGRFATLEEVINFYLTGVNQNPNLDPNMHALRYPVSLTQPQIEDLIAFMKTLTDQSLLTNEEYSNPFE